MRMKRPTAAPDEKTKADDMVGKQPNLTGKTPTESKRHGRHRDSIDRPGLRITNQEVGHPRIGRKKASAG